jgi:hypothetical protein
VDVCPELGGSAADSAAAARFAALLVSRSPEAAVDVVVGGRVDPDGDRLGRAVLASAADDPEVSEEAGGAVDADGAALSVLLVASAWLALATGLGEAAAIVSAVAAEVSEEGFTAGEPVWDTSAGSESDRTAVLSAGLSAAALSAAALSAAGLSAAGLSATGVSATADGLPASGLAVAGLSLAGLSVPGEGHFGLVVRAADSRAGDAGGSVDREAEVLADEPEPDEPEPDEDSGFDRGDESEPDVVRWSAEASFPLPAPLLATPELGSDSGSGSTPFRTTVSG